jgi:HNH endonuclease
MPPYPSYSDDDVIKAVAQAYSYSDVLRALGLRAAGGNHATIKRVVARLQLDTSHFDPHRGKRDWNTMFRPAIPLEKVLVKDSTYSRRMLKKRLYAEGLKQRFCELCGQGESWNGATMALILDHVNGVHDDNRLSNLRIVCPNCNATLDTHCGKNVNPKKDQRLQPQLHRRKVERPSYQDLLRDIETTSYAATGRKYGVSDSCIRKWVRMYEKYGS